MIQSRKVKILIIDAVFAVVALVASTFLQPEWSDFVLKLTAILQAPVVALIAGIAIEDAGAKAGNNFRFYDK